jgi:MFS family permease
MTQTSGDPHGPSAAGSGPEVPADVRRWTAVICWLAVALEGFDLVALGAAIPTILDSRFLGITAPEATFVATISLVGVGIGAAGVGPMVDKLGRRIGLIASIALFSVFTLLVPLAPSVAMLGLFRFVAGLGLGACLPTALTVMSEVTPASRRATSTTVTMTGYHVGAVATSVLALLVVPNWQVLFYAGGILGRWSCRWCGSGCRSPLSTSRRSSSRPPRRLRRSRCRPCCARPTCSSASAPGSGPSWGCYSCTA